MYHHPYNVGDKMYIINSNRFVGHYAGLVPSSGSIVVETMNGVLTSFHSTQISPVCVTITNEVK